MRKFLKLKKNTEEVNLDILSEDYLSNNEEDSDEMLKLKSIIKDLDETDFKCLMLYIELGSLRKVAKEFHCSVSTLYQKIKNIQEKIREQIDKSAL